MNDIQILQQIIKGDGCAFINRECGSCPLDVKESPENGIYLCIEEPRKAAKIKLETYTREELFEALL